MPIRTVAAMLINAEGSEITPSQVSNAHNISTGQASQELNRLVKKGIARKTGRGKYVILDIQKAQDFIGNKTQQTQQDHIMGDNIGGGIFTRPHRIWFKSKVQNEPVISDPRPNFKGLRNKLDTWRFWKANKSLTFYEKLIKLPNALVGTVRYAEGIRKRTITVEIENVMVNGDALQDHMRDIWDSTEQALRKLSRTDGFDLGLIVLSCDPHFAIPLPVTSGWHLPPPGSIRINDFWWLDSSHGWPEMETHLLTQCNRVLDLPEQVRGITKHVASLPDNIRLALREELTDILLNEKDKPKAPLPPSGEEIV